MRYYFPDLPNHGLLTEMCQKYKVLSLELQDKKEDIEYSKMEKKMIESKKDRDFEKRLKSIDLDDEDDDVLAVD